MAAFTRPLLRSFAGGEITPELFARLDLDKFQTGLAKALNFRVLPHGPAQNRAGLRFVNRARSHASQAASRLIPFAFSVDQTMALEFGHQYIRFHTGGATLLEAAKTMGGLTAANPVQIHINAHGYANGDWVFVSSLDPVFLLRGRWVVVQNSAANTFTLTDLFGQDIDGTDLVAPSVATTFARAYTIASPYGAADLFDLHYAQSADVLTITHPGYDVMELRRAGPTNWSLVAASFAPSITAPAGITATAGGPGGGTPQSYSYKATAVAGSNYEESLPSPAGSANQDLSIAGNYIDVTPAAVAGAVRYNIYKRGGGGLYGYVGQSDGSAFRDERITPDMSQSPPDASTPFVGAGNRPSTVTYTEQRRAFAATDNRPQTVWMTRSATEGNLTQSVPVRDNDAISFRLASGQQNRIRHLVPLGDLIALTSGSEFRIYASGGDALTPSNVTPKPQSYVGANNVQPAVAEASILYVQSQGSHIREFAYAGDGLNGALYRSNDISILAPHLFDGFDVIDLAFSRTSSCPTLWAVRSDGLLLGMTYVPGQNVRAWFQVETAGAVESACCVSENGEDALYVVVRRVVQGQTVRYIERMEDRRFGQFVESFFVDAGLTYRGAPTTAFGGLWHLVGKEVSILADGAVQPRQTVGANGRITLLHPSSVVHVGLPYKARLETLPLSWQSDGFGQGTIKNISKAHLRLSESSGIHIGPSDGRLVEVKQRTSEPYGSPPEPINGWKHVNLPPSWQDDGSVAIEQNDPLPVTVLAMVLDTVSSG